MDQLEMKLNDQQLEPIQTPTDRIWAQVKALYPYDRQQFMMKWAMALRKRYVSEEVIIEALWHARKALEPYAMLNQRGAFLNSLITRIEESRLERESEQRKKEERELLGEWSQLSRKSS
jgi:hypothetical protein